MAYQSGKEPRNGPGHDGRDRAFTKPGERGLEVHHDPNVARVHDGMEERTSGNLARSGKPKALHPVSLHNGMTEQQRAASGVGGLGHATTIDGLPGANPLNPNPLPKFTPEVKVKPGMRSRITDTPHSGAPGENHARARANPPDPTIGKQILAEAVSDCGGANKPRGIGINPFGRG